MPQALVGVALYPQDRRFRSGLVLAIYGKADLFQEVGHIVADLAPLVLGADDKDDVDGFTLVHPLAIHQLGAHGFHLGGDDLPRFLRIVSVLELLLADGPGQLGVIGEYGVQQRVARPGKAAIDLLNDVLPVHQPVERLAKLRTGKGVQVTLHRCRVKRQLAVGTVGKGVRQVIHPLHRLVQIGIGDVIGIHVHLADAQPGDSRLVRRLFQEHDHVQPAAHPFHRLGGGGDLDFDLDLDLLFDFNSLDDGLDDGLDLAFLLHDLGLLYHDRFHDPLGLGRCAARGQNHGCDQR